MSTLNSIRRRLGAATRHAAFAHRTRRTFLWLLAAAVVAPMAPAALAAGYPEKPIRLVVGYPPGGANDILARQVAAKLAETLGTPVVVDNKPGANGIIGGDAVAKAAPDGYTLLLAGLTSQVLNALTYAKLPYDAINDFTGISTVASSPIIFAVRPDLPVNNIQELIALAKAKPGTLNFATVGTGGSTRVFFELFKGTTGTDIRYIPYKGGGPAIADVLGGQVQAIAIDFPALYPFIKQGQLHGIAITSEARNPLLPDLKTMAEQGLPDMTAGNWYCILAPAKLPRPIAEKLHAALLKAVNSPDFKEKLQANGMDPMTSAGPDAFAQFVKGEHARWGRVVKSANIQSE